ncbi:hypothetical protein Hanom_Chr15g01381871 [Helianthus anomalus]
MSLTTGVDVTHAAIPTVVLISEILKEDGLATQKCKDIISLYIQLYQTFSLNYYLFLLLVI